MNSFNTNTHDFRTTRKCFSLMTGCLVFVLLMSHASCRPSETDNAPAAYTDAEYTDVDDIEWDNFALAETTTKDHPIIYYKEDIVSEDYDPNKENKSSSKEQEPQKGPLRRRKYKEISRHNRLNRTENYRYVYPEKVYFDVLPTKDEVTKDDDTKFNERNIRVEVISLTDDNSQMSSDLKRLANKRPKKFLRRQRQRRDLRDDTLTHTLRHKRHYCNGNHYVNQLPQYRGVLQNPQVFIVKHPVRGKYKNVGVPNGHKTTMKPVTPGSVENRVGGTDTTTEEPMPIWDFQTRPTRRPPPPIIHSGDEDFVTRRPTTQRPTTQPPRFSPSGNRNQQFKPAAMIPNPVFQTTRRPLSQPARADNHEVSACIWAIVSCCNAERNVRYQCFEREGCNGAFWDLNPCADDVHSKAVEASFNHFQEI